MLDPRIRDEIGSEGFEYLASLRPSRIREVQAGRLGWTTVELVDVESGHARALREGLELFGIRVNLTHVGTPRLLFYELTEGRSLKEAVERLRAHDRELSMWRLFRGTRAM